MRRLLHISVLRLTCFRCRRPATHALLRALVTEWQTCADRARRNIWLMRSMSVNMTDVARLDVQPQLLTWNHVVEFFTQTF